MQIKSHQITTHPTQSKALFSVRAKEMTNHSKVSSNRSVLCEKANLSEILDCADSQQDHSEGHFTRKEEEDCQLKDAEGNFKRKDEKDFQINSAKGNLMQHRNEVADDFSTHVGKRCVENIKRLNQHAQNSAWPCLSAMFNLGKDDSHSRARQPQVVDPKNQKIWTCYSTALIIHRMKNILCCKTLLMLGNHQFVIKERYQSR